MPEADIAVVIPAWNAADLVGDAVASALAQNILPREIVVVIDGDDQATAAAARRCADPRLTVIVLAERGGANRARNAGVAASTSPVIGFLDADDLWLPDHLSHAAARLAAEDQVDAVQCGFRVRRRDRSSIEAVRAGVLGGARLTEALVGHAFAMTMSALVVRRAALERVGGFDEALPRQQDRDLMLRLAVDGRVAFLPEVSVEKRQQDRSVSRTQRGYTAGLALIAARHPVFAAKENADMLAYLALRMVVKLVLAGRFAAAAAELGALRRLPVAFPDALLAYGAGRRRRAAMRRALAAPG